MKGRELITLLGGAVLLSFSTFMYGTVVTHAAPVRIVAIGASNTHGWYVGNQGAYPAQLQALLRAKGIQRDQLGGVFAHGVGLAVAPAIIDTDVTPDGPTQLLQAV